MRHLRLSSLSDTRMCEEVEGSRRILGEVLGRPLEGFCYPYGDLNDQAVQAVREAGYSYACAYRAGMRHGTYAIPRIYVGERDSGFRLQVKLRWLPTIRRISRALGMRWP